MLESIKIPNQASVRLDPADLNGWVVRFSKHGWNCIKCGSPFFKISNSLDGYNPTGNPSDNCFSFERTCANTSCRWKCEDAVYYLDFHRELEVLYPDNEVSDEDYEEEAVKDGLAESAASLLEDFKLDQAEQADEKDYSELMADVIEGARETDETGDEDFSVGDQVWHAATGEPGIVGDTPAGKHDQNEVPVIWESGEDNGFYGRSQLRKSDPDQGGIPMWFNHDNFQFERRPFTPVEEDTPARKIDNKDFQRIRNATFGLPDPAVLSRAPVGQTLRDAKSREVVRFSQSDNPTHRWIVCRIGPTGSEMLNLDTGDFKNIHHSHTVSISQMQLEG